uniref:Uncharacterized protein n=1 Tax=Globisporangium ultimum (strain ATCC 200006 / CBS 805.95 / DAOM BR144) TaxID=431595 RepID=K3X0L4_GLOUD
MTVIADKILIVFLDGKVDAASATSASPAECTALNEVAKRGSNGVLVLPPETSHNEHGRSDLESLLSVDRDAAGNVAFKFPKMPVAFFSTFSNSCELVTKLGLEQVHDLNARTADDKSFDSKVKALLTESTHSKQLVFLHLDTPSVLSDSSHWVHGLVSELLELQERDAESRCLVALVQTAAQLHRSQAANDANPFRPRQSYEKIDASYPACAASSSNSSELPRLLFSFYQKDRTRHDEVQRFDEAEIDALGSYGAMSALMFMKEMAFRLGFAPKYGA